MTARENVDGWEVGAAAEVVESARSAWSGHTGVVTSVWRDAVGLRFPGPPPEGAPATPDRPGELGFVNGEIRRPEGETNR